MSRSSQGHTQHRNGRKPQILVFWCLREELFSKHDARESAAQQCTEQPREQPHVARRRAQAGCRCCCRWSGRRCWRAQEPGGETESGPYQQQVRLGSREAFFVLRLFQNPGRFDDCRLQDGHGHASGCGRERCHCSSLSFSKLSKTQTVECSPQHAGRCARHLLCWDGAPHAGTDEEVSLV
jgi:hypothetical protein